MDVSGVICFLLQFAEYDCKYVTYQVINQEVFYVLLWQM